MQRPSRDVQIEQLFTLITSVLHIPFTDGITIPDILTLIRDSTALETRIFVHPLPKDVSGFCTTIGIENKPAYYAIILSPMLTGELRSHTVLHECCHILRGDVDAVVPKGLNQHLADLRTSDSASILEGIVCHTPSIPPNSESSLYTRHVEREQICEGTAYWLGMYLTTATERSFNTTWRSWLGTKQIRPFARNGR